MAESHKSHRSHSCYIAQGVFHAVHAPAGYARLLAGCALVQAAIDKMIAIRWGHMLQRAQWHDSCLCTHFVARCRFDAKTTPCAPLIHCPSARARQLRVHSIQALLHALIARHHFESLKLTVPPAMHKRRYGGPSGRVQVDAVLRMEERALVVAVEVRVPVAMVPIPKVDCAGESVSPSLCWPLPSLPTPVFASRRLLRRRSSCGISWWDSR